MSFFILQRSALFPSHILARIGLDHDSWQDNAINWLFRQDQWCRILRICFLFNFEISLNAACLSLVALAFSCMQEKESEACQCGFHHVCATVFPDCCSAQPVSCVTKIGHEGHFSRTKSDCGAHAFVGIG